MASSSGNDMIDVEAQLERVKKALQGAEYSLKVLKPSNDSYTAGQAFVVKLREELKILENAVKSQIKANQGDRSSSNVQSSNQVDVGNNSRAVQNVSTCDVASRLPENTDKRPVLRHNDEVLLRARCDKCLQKFKDSPSAIDHVMTVHKIADRSNARPFVTVKTVGEILALQNRWK